MDAANKPYFKNALLLSVVLVLFAAPVLAQTLQVNPTTVNLPPSGGGNCVPVSVTSSGGAVTFTTSAPAGWYSRDPITATTPATVQICVTQQLGTAPPASTLTFTETTNSANTRSIMVNYIVGGGGGGGIITPNTSLLQSNVVPGGVSTQNVTLSTTSVAPIGVNATV